MAMTERPSPAPQPINLLDRAIYAIAPNWGARRIATRRAFQHAESHLARIEAAEHNETRGSRWMASRLSPDSQLEQDLQTTRDRSREIYQNDAMGGAVDNKVNHVIGTGHTPHATIEEYEDVITKADAERYNKQLHRVYAHWNQKADRSGRKSLWMCSRVAGRHNEFDGESFTILSDSGRADKPIPLALQVVDSERINTPPEMSGDPSVRLGIRYTEPNGDIVGYYVQRSHPGDTKNVDIKYDFIPADRMLHVFEQWFAEQSRGLPWMTRALNRAKDAKDYDEAMILKAQIETCYAGFVKPGAGTGYLAASGAATGTAGGRNIEDILPGTIRYLDQNEEITFSAPSSPGNSFAPYMEWLYRRVSAAINWPYEMVAKNWNGLSFAAGRLVLTDAKKATEVGQKLMQEQWFSRVWERLVYESVVVGEVDIDPRMYLQFPHVFHSHEWTPPRWEYALNPGEEVNADVTELGQNLALLEEKIASRGYSLEEFIARKKREKEMLEAAGLTAPVIGVGGAPGQQSPKQAAEKEKAHKEEVAA